MPEGVFRSGKIPAIIAVAGGVHLAIRSLLVVSGGSSVTGDVELAIEESAMEWFGPSGVEESLCSACRQ